MAEDATAKRPEGWRSRLAWMVLEKVLLALVVLGATVTYGAQMERVKRVDAETLSIAKLRVDAASNWLAVYNRNFMSDARTWMSLKSRIQYGMAAREAVKAANEESGKDAANNVYPGDMIWVEPSLLPVFNDLGDQLAAFNKLIIDTIGCIDARGNTPVTSSEVTAAAMTCFEGDGYATRFDAGRVALDRAQCAGATYMAKVTQRPPIGLFLPEPETELPTLTAEEIKRCTGAAPKSP